jgi:chromosome segregation ATPase
MENFESNHPVLQQLKDRITELEASIEQKNTSLQTSLENANRYRNEKWNYEERVKNVLIEALEDYDEATIKHIAEQLNIELTKTASIEVNVTFTIDVEYEIGSEPDPDWDFDFSVSHDSIVDYSSDVVWSKTS